MNDSSILVTGGAGFIGHHLVENLLKTGQSVFIVDNFNDFYDPSEKTRRTNKLQSKYEKLKVFKTLEECFDFSNKINSIYHLAGQPAVRWCNKHPEKCSKENEIFTQKLLNKVKEQFKGKSEKPHIIFTSSSTVYGDANEMCSENSELKPKGVYGKSKQLCEEQLEKFSKDVNSPVSIARLFFCLWS